MTPQELSLSLRLGHRQPIDEIVAAFRRAHGNLTRAARDLHVLHRTLSRWIVSHPELRHALAEVRAKEPARPRREDPEEKAPSENRGVYCIQCGDAVKIGKAEDISRRLRDLQLANPEPLRLLAVLSTEPDAELAIQQSLRSARLHGEWYRMTPAVRQVIAKARESKDIPWHPAMVAEV